jgi:hypothetical protein
MSLPRYLLTDKLDESNFASSSMLGWIRCRDAHSSRVCTCKAKSCRTSRIETDEAATTAGENGSEGDPSDLLAVPEDEEAREEDL